MTTPRFGTLPFPLTPAPADAWQTGGDGTMVTGTAPPRSDIFIDPSAGPAAGTEPVLGAATLLGVPPTGDFRFSARVGVDFAATFDAGVLLLWVDDRHWAKLCFEYSPDGDPMIVSVVARGVADDANSFVVEGRSVWLRASRVKQAFAFHASLDGSVWRLVRHFALDGADAHLEVGLEVQSPTGDGCTARFDEVRFSRDPLVDLRDGS